ncbi:MAG: DUF58 domain-containing protein [Chloroflexaceae bacterium]|nr:DUF58 domain-containing protein [Chloroflexaceae bacterium]NJO04840.1 DUF58 domain-containing protein [Chloroflexaceae bacterium]
MTEPLFDSGFLRKLDRLALITRRAMLGEMQGERRSPRRGASVEFADFRPYTVGDDIRQIDWNLYARMERFFLKLFVAEEELTIHLLIDTSRSMDWGEPNKFEYAKRVAAAFGYIALSSLDRVTVTAFGSSERGGAHLRGVRGKRGAFPLFNFMQQLAPGGAGSLAAACQRYAQTARTPGPLLICTDLLDAGWEDALRALSSRPFDMTVLHVLAPQEISPTLTGDFRLIDSEGGGPIEITADDDMLRRYQREFNEWRNEVETFCNGRGIIYLFADTSLPVEEFVLAQMRQRGVLR